jgi:hypothetical protein
MIRSFRERLDLAVEILLDRRNARIPEIHERNVPDIATVRAKGDGLSGPTSGTCPQRVSTIAPLRQAAFHF